MSTDTTTTTESTRVAVRQEMSWTDPSLSDLPDRGWVTPVALLVLAAGATSVDVLVMYPAIARAMGHSPVQSWLTAIGLGLLALVAAGMAGWTWRGARGNHPGSRAVLLLPSLLMLAWLALGVLIMTLRMQVSEVSTTVNFEGVEQQTSTSESGFDLVAAGVFIAVHVLCGVLVFSDMYHWRNDAYRAGRQALDRLKRTRQALAAREGTFQHLLANYHKRQEELDRIPQDAETARLINANFAAELKQRVRQEIAVGLSDPTVTGITSADHPSNPAFRADG